ncbi:putative deoxyribonuclease TATDN2 [Mercenaria mercenaria]|uniref:putative deoxyribonuclease TATDN2 n=1 Tax=Mercenaria mercenaria TaxID=6596 RepID=UPI00234E98C5|nr:putative deoxyribonuclease TATDN2 [Mercenaria mercenaria]
MSSWITQGAVIAIGWHPRTSGTEEDWQRFTTLMSSPKVTALGEIGLDRTEHPDTWFTQMLNMERALSTLGPKHVLVLHSRSLNDTQTPDESWFTILQILKNHPKVGRDRLVHCHCFTGTQALTLRWLQEFPNTYFGYTNLVRKFSEKDDPEKLESIRRMEPGRMLLETDAPYFGTGGVRRTTPALLGYAALEVGRIRNEPWKDLLRRCSENAYRLYVQGQSPEL